MPLTREERAEINRQNAGKSTGPKTEEGKKASRKNALRHGLRAEVVAMPNEDPAAVEARSDAWNEYYRPQSPAAQHLVNQCVAATLLADRVNAYHDAALAKQVRDARAKAEAARVETVERQVRMLQSDPALAVRGLAMSLEGCAELIGRWERLERVLLERGFWPNLERDEAVRLQGFDPVPSPARPETWRTVLFALVARESPSAAALNAMFDPRVLPDTFRGVYRADFLPDRETCQAGLREIVADNLAAIRAAEAELRRRGAGEPDDAPARALVLGGDKAARLFLRYHAEARVSFHRAYAELVKTLDRDASTPENEDETENQTETEDGVEAGDAVPPNEPNPPDQPAASPEKITGSTDRPGPEPAPKLAATPADGGAGRDETAPAAGRTVARGRRR